MRRPRNYLKSRVENLLKENVEARERRNRLKAICFEVSKSYPDVLNINPEAFKGAVDMAINLDRYFRLCQREDKSLRGSDYEDKAVVEQEAVLEIGYEVGYNSFNEKD